MHSVKHLLTLREGRQNMAMLKTLYSFMTDFIWFVMSNTVSFVYERTFERIQIDKKSIGDFDVGR